MSRQSMGKQIAAIVLGCVLSACATVHDAGSVSADAELLRADAEYEAYNREFGFAAASEAYIDFETGFLIDAEQGFIVGRNDILADRQLDTVPSPVSWAPDGAMAATSGDFGITWGRFGVEGEPAVSGSYLTVWRQVDGEWKIVTDIAIDDAVSEGLEGD